MTSIFVNDQAIRADQKIWTLSSGQRRRLDVAIGVLGRPEMLFLDEPTAPFDPHPCGREDRGQWQSRRTRQATQFTLQSPQDTLFNVVVAAAVLIYLWINTSQDNW